MKPMRKCWSTACSGVAEVVGVGVAGVKFGDAGSSKLDRRRLAKFRTFTKRGRSLED
jgi:hypothetical protein